MVENKNIQIGYVYVMSHISQMGYKIGYTMFNPQKRAKEIRRVLELDSDLTIEYYIQVVNPYEIEQLTHRYLAAYRIGKTEWFNCSITNAILTIKGAAKKIDEKHKTPSFSKNEHYRDHSHRVYIDNTLKRELEKEQEYLSLINRHKSNKADKLKIISEEHYTNLGNIRRKYEPLIKDAEKGTSIFVYLFWMTFVPLIGVIIWGGVHTLDDLIRSKIIFFFIACPFLFRIADFLPSNKSTRVGEVQFAKNEEIKAENSRYKEEVDRVNAKYSILISNLEREKKL